MTAAVPDSRRLLPGLAFAIAGAITFSGKSIIVKLAYRHGVDAVTLIMLRMLFALPIFALMAWWASRGKAPLSPRDWMGVLGLGFSGYLRSRPAIDSDAVAFSAEQDWELREAPVRDWLVKQDLPGELPLDFDYRHYSFHGKGELAGRETPVEAGVEKGIASRRDIAASAKIRASMA